MQREWILLSFPWLILHIFSLMLKEIRSRLNDTETENNNDDSVDLVESLLCQREEKKVQNVKSELIEVQSELDEVREIFKNVEERWNHSVQEDQNADRELFELQNKVRFYMCPKSSQSSSSLVD
jgi:hypothetical protein